MVAATISLFGNSSDTSTMIYQNRHGLDFRAPIVSVSLHLMGNPFSSPEHIPLLMQI